MNEKGITLAQSHDFLPKLHTITISSIRKSSLFIGVITCTGDQVERDRVLTEWEEAKTVGIPTILLIEESAESLLSLEDGIYFNREHPEKALNFLNEEIPQINKEKEQSNGWAWSFSGTTAAELVGQLSHIG
ncbi:MAG TPA: hypothetical protein DCR93_01085 [Cytophagales bacterium]|nr:hypothetical protein [Cytophagales bacterium]HAP58150.1 hypothetical protein [Cytophagales bacterium]